jgi:hypothetical protein
MGSAIRLAGPSLFLFRTFARPKNALRWGFYAGNNVAMTGRCELNLPFGVTPSPGPERSEEISRDHCVCQREPVTSQQQTNVSACTVSEAF